MTLKELQNSYSKPGKVVYLAIRPARLEPVKFVEKVEALKDLGLDGDHHTHPGGNQQVTLIQAEHLDVISSLLCLIKITPEMTGEILLLED